jgi:hypothetical protein
MPGYSDDIHRASVDAVFRRLATEVVRLKQDGEQSSPGRSRYSGRLATGEWFDIVVPLRPGQPASLQIVKDRMGRLDCEMTLRSDELEARIFLSSTYSSGMVKDPVQIAMVRRVRDEVLAAAGDEFTFHGTTATAVSDL